MSYPTSRDEQAAYWHLKLQEPAVSAEEIQAALAWQADPDNRTALEKVAAFWDAWPARPAARAAETSRSRRALAWRATAALLLAAGIGTWFAVSGGRQNRESEAHEYATSVGEIRTVVLSDGSKVVLGGATSIHVRYAADLRHVEMSPGEALFTVTRDAQRPFIVEMPNGSARVLGTQFNVHRGPDEATVAVLEGTVRVALPHWRTGRPADLQAGTQVAISTDGRMGPVRAADMHDVASWQSGGLVFSDRTLRSVVADLNRYSRKSIMLTTAALADTRISGTVKLDQVDSWIEALSSVLDTRLSRSEHGITLAPAARAGLSRAAEK